MTELFNGMCTGDSARASDDYFEVNNYGVYRRLKKDFTTLRPAGRPDYQLIYVKGGRIEYERAGRCEVALAGTLLLYRPYEMQKYRYTRGEEGTYLWFHFTGTGCEKLVGELFGAGERAEVGTAYEIEEAVADMRAHVLGTDPLSREYARGRLIVMLASLKQRQGKHRDRVMDHVIAQIHRERFNEGSNAAYAALADMSESHFLRRFTAYVGVTPHKYKSRYLMRQAAELLRDTEMNVSEVADALGIDDSLYFSRMFKREWCVSPMAYKKG